MTNLPKLMASIVNDTAATAALLRQARAAANALLGRDEPAPAVNPYPKTVGGMLGLVEAEMLATATAFASLRSTTAAVVGALGVGAEDAPPVDASPEDDGDEAGDPPPLPAPDDDDAANLPPSDDDLRDPTPIDEDGGNDDTILTAEGHKVADRVLAEQEAATRATEVPAPEKESPTYTGSVAAQVAEVEAPAYEADAVAIPIVHEAGDLFIRTRSRHYRPATEADLFSGAALYRRGEAGWVQVEYRPH